MNSFTPRLASLLVHLPFGKRFVPFVLILFAYVVAGSSPAAAQNFYWKDNASNGRWDWGSSQWYSSSASSLVGAPATDGSAIIWFENVGGTATYINAGFSGGWFKLNSLYTAANSTGRNYVIDVENGGTGIELYNKLETVSGGGTLTVNAATQLGANSEINAVGGSLTLGELRMNGKTLNSYGANSLNITGVISGTGTYNIKNQGITVTYSGSSANTFSGATTVENSSTLVLNKSANTAAIAGALTINSGATLRTDAANQLANNLVTVNGAFNMNSQAQSLALAGSGTVTMSAVLTNNNTGTDTFSGKLTSTGSLVKTNSGTLILSGTANDYSGGTTVAGGTLRAASIGTGGLALNSGTFAGNDSTARTFTNSIMMGGNVQLGDATGTGSLTFSNVDLNGSTRTLTVSNNTSTIAGAISNGGLTKAGAGTLILSGTPSYTGTTTVTAGTLMASNANMASTNYSLTGGVFWAQGDNRIDNTAAITLGGGDLQIYGNDTIGDNGVTLTAATISSNRVQANSTVTINGKVTGSGTLVKYGSGALWLNSISNDLSGTVILQQGTIRITNAANLGTAALQLGSGATTATFQVSSNLTRTAALSITNASTAGVVDVATNVTFTQSGNLSQIGGADNSTKFGKSGAGTLVLNGTGSTYGGQLQIGQGTVIIGQNNALSTNTTTANRGVDLGLNVGDVNQTNNVSLLGSNGVTISNSIYVAQNTNSATRTIGLDGTGSTTFNNEIYLDGTLTVTAASGGNVAVSGNIITNDSGGGGGITKTGAGTATLSGNNTYSGATTVSEGALRAAANNALGGTGASTTVSSGAALEVSGGITTAEALSLAGTGISSGGALRNISGNNTGTGAITLTASSRINSDAGALALSGGITGTGYALTVGGAGDVNISTSGINTSTGGTLVKDGAGVLTVGAAGNYTGGTTLSAGTLRAGNNSALGTGSLAVNGGTLASDSATARTLANNITMGGDVILGEASTGTGDLKLSGTVALGASGRTFTVSNSLSELSGNIGGDAGVGLTKSGSGTLVLSGNNSHTGTTTVGAGVLVLSNGSAIANTAAVSLDNVAGATLSVAGSETIGSLRGGGATGGNVSIAGGQTLTVGETGSQTFAGVISNTGALAKTGAGTLTLTAANTYSGATTVEAGKLVVNGSIASSAVTVSNTGTIGGSGSVGALTINGGGILSPGNSPGTLYAASSTWGNGGKYDWEILSLADDPGMSWDLLSVTPGSLDLTGLSSGGYTINLITLSGPTTQGALSGFNSTATYTNWLIASAPTISGFSANLFNLDSSLFVGATGTFGIEQRAITGGQGLFLTYTGGGEPIPEPGTWAAAALLAGTAGFVRWRRRKAKA